MGRQLVYVCCLLLVLISCEHDVPDPLEKIAKEGEDPIALIDSCDPDTVYFERDILPILSSNCAFSGCHDQGTAKDDIVLTTYENILNSDIIKKYDPDDSKIVEAISDDDPDDRMPPSTNDPLTAQQIALIRKWISQGAQNLTCIGSCDSTQAGFSTSIFPLIESRCKGCHSGSSPGGGIHLTNYTEIRLAAMDGRLLGVVKQLNGYKAMPLGGQKLPVCQIKQIEKWIINGANND